MNKFEKILLTIFFIELFVGGGGRLIDFGILSIRQVLFILVIGVFFVRIIRENAYLNKDINTLVRFNPVSIGIYLLLASFVASAGIGYINGHSLSLIITDFFRVVFFVVYFPLAYYIADTRFSKQRIVTILKYSALAVAIFTIVVSLLGKTIFSSNFAPFYNFMNWIMNDDLFFRPSNSVFYKSHLFVVIALIISLNAVLTKNYSKLDIANIILCSISAIWSETRGFLLAFMISILMIIILDTKVIVDPIKGFVSKCQKLFEEKQFLAKFVILIFVLVATPFLYNHMTLERFQQDVATPAEQDENNVANEAENEVNDISVNKRIEFILDSKTIFTDNPTNLVLGTGYGKEIAGRVTGIEMSFLDILVEQGIIGLLIWFFLFFLVYYNYYYIFKRGYQLTPTDISLMASFMGLLLLTNINPFINNPIGISFFVVLLIISQNKKEQYLKEVSK
ncbi:O-antigen ligase family protein [Bacillus sp. 1P02SD]|uniref:O-antigen ligase family protein n=1 Tax=Bacillus sp. 1P02SD TaxID=3132264 RepID=UPI0039A1FD34